MTLNLAAHIAWSLLQISVAYYVGRRLGRNEGYQKALQNARSMSAGLRMSRGPE